MYHPSFAGVTFTGHTQARHFPLLASRVQCAIERTRLKHRNVIIVYSWPHCFNTHHRQNVTTSHTFAQAKQLCYNALNHHDCHYMRTEPATMLMNTHCVYTQLHYMRVSVTHFSSTYTPTNQLHWSGDVGSKPGRARAFIFPLWGFTADALRWSDPPSKESCCFS